MFNQRTDPHYSKLRELITSGQLGKINRISWIITTWFRSHQYYASGGWRATWKGEGGGVLLNQCPPTTTPCTADTNNDQTVGLDDLLTVLANFGNNTTNGPTDGDIDPPGAPDTTVGLGDLLLVLANFGNTCP